MARKTNRAFTLVELIIVIAVIGVLAAILIPVFSNVVKKANIADKTSLARNLNTQLAAENDGTARVLTMSEAMAVAHKTGYTDDQIFNTKTAGNIVFNTATGNFAVAEKVENGTATLAYADQGMTTAPAASLFTAVDANEIPAVADQEYGMYLVDSTNVLNGITVNTAVGLDVGAVPVAVINFENTTSTDTFTFNTNGGVFNVNAPLANVNHYGFSDTVNIIAVANASYHEFGTVGVINISAGHLVIEAGAHVLQGITALTLDGVSITLFAEAALVGEQSQLQSIITDNTNSNNIEYVASMPASTGFAGGSGTEADPYIIRTAQNFMNMAYYASTYTYYKVADGVEKINLKGIEPFYNDYFAYTSFTGVFDGNGVKIINASYQLFAFPGYGGSTATVAKNFDIDTNLQTSSNAAGAVVSYAYYEMLLENITVTGTIEANYPASFAAYAYHTCPTAISFRNCVSYATLISNKAGCGCAGFITNPIATVNQKLYFYDCQFLGEMYRVGSTSKFWYFEAQSNGKLSFHVENSQPIAATQNNGVGTYDFACQSGTNSCQNTFYNASNKIGNIQNITLTADQVAKYETISVPTVAGAARAEAVLTIGPNKADWNGSGKDGGNFTGAYIVEDCALNGDNFVTNKVRYYDITVNGDATPKTGISADGHTFNIVNDNYGTSYGSAGITIKLYNEAGTLLAVYTYNFPKA